MQFYQQDLVRSMGAGKSLLNLLPTCNNPTGPVAGDPKNITQTHKILTRDRALPQRGQDTLNRTVTDGRPATGLRLAISLLSFRFWV